jgi:ABC-type multidrug transport system fused ATPase/permease subunit
MNKGNIVEVGSHDELMAKKAYYYNLYVSQG